MSTATTTVDITDSLAIYCGPEATITGPDVNGIYTISCDSVAQADLEFFVSEAAKDADMEANRQTLLTKARTALTNNGKFLDIASPTQAQAVAQVKALTRQMNAIIKIVASDLPDTAGT